LDDIRNEYHVSPPPPLDLRPSLADIYRQTYFRTDQCAEKAGISEEIILMMFSHVPVDPADAAKVLQALSEMIGRNCTLETVKVELVRPKTIE
jgi:hypothetical protein